MPSPKTSLCRILGPPSFNSRCLAIRQKSSHAVFLRHPALNSKIVLSTLYRAVSLSVRDSTCCFYSFPRIVSEEEERAQCNCFVWGCRALRRGKPTRDNRAANRAGIGQGAHPERDILSRSI